jgi:hypothetical protein
MTEQIQALVEAHKNSQVAQAEQTEEKDDQTEEQLQDQ